MNNVNLESYVSYECVLKLKKSKVNIPYSIFYLEDQDNEVIYCDILDSIADILEDEEVDVEEFVEEFKVNFLDLLSPTFKKTVVLIQGEF